MFTMKIDTGFAAFDDGQNGRYEICRILEEVQARIDYGCIKGVCMDLNGNRVGEWQIESKDYH